MKILKKPIIKPVTCKVCGCIYQPKPKDLMFSAFCLTKDSTICPVCKSVNQVEFECEDNRA